MTSTLHASKAHWHAHNPWADQIVYIPIEQLAACAAGGTIRIAETGEVRPFDVAYLLEHWRSRGDALDAYILPQPDGRHSLGVRYGAGASEYYSPHNANPELTLALLQEFHMPDKKVFETKSIPSKYQPAVLPRKQEALVMAVERKDWAHEARGRDQPGTAREFELTALLLEFYSEHVDSTGD